MVRRGWSRAGGARGLCMRRSSGDYAPMEGCSARPPTLHWHRPSCCGVELWTHQPLVPDAAEAAASGPAVCWRCERRCDPFRVEWEAYFPSVFCAKAVGECSDLQCSRLGGRVGDASTLWTVGVDFPTTEDEPARVSGPVDLARDGVLQLCPQQAAVAPQGASVERFVLEHLTGFQVRLLTPTPPWSLPGAVLLSSRHYVGSG
jgi:hypothetical protein